MKEEGISPADKLYRLLKEQGLNFFVAVPCKLLAELISLLEHDQEITYAPVTREEEGLGILAGAFLAGKRPAIVMQNSGIGNCINAICSLLNYYQIPIVLIVSHRGGEEEKIDAQKPMGEATKPLLASAKILFYEVATIDVLPLVEQGISESYAQQRSVAFLLPAGFWNNPA